MASLYFAKKNVAWGLPIKLFPQATTEWLASPTIAAGDFKRVGYSSALAVTLTIDNPTTLPATSPASSGWVMISLSATEMNNDIVTVDWKDASGAEWASGGLVVMTTADGVDDLVTVTDAIASVTGAVGSVTAGVTVTTNNDKTGYGLADSAITSAKFAAGAINAAVIATDAIDADALAADVTTELQSGLLTTSAFNTKLGTPAGASVSVDIAAIKAETASIQADTNDLQTQIGTAGAGLTAVASAANLATLTAYVDTEVATILAAVDTEVATLITNVASILVQTGTTGVVLSTAQMQALADIILARGSSNVDNTAAADSLYEAIGFLLRANTASGNLVIYKTDGTTVFSTNVFGTDPAAEPIVRIGVVA